ncbi:hypothetical protein RBEAN4_1335 [Rickettsia bellii str. RML An4]|uniref:Uncharacterized protein n=1 Tax=Rickettsia bellii str. RML An4 TaxID=1359193 RepID=A0A0F3QDH4_RICBE|nr:hypothetical protein RBEAN4_1335 [Rickettsia bellii str. RML An4]
MLLRACHPVACPRDPVIKNTNIKARFLSLYAGSRGQATG